MNGSASRGREGKAIERRGGCFGKLAGPECFCEGRMGLFSDVRYLMVE